MTLFSVLKKLNLDLILIKYYLIWQQNVHIQIRMNVFIPSNGFTYRQKSLLEGCCLYPCLTPLSASYRYQNAAAGS